MMTSFFRLTLDMAGAVVVGLVLAVYLLAAGVSALISSALEGGK